MVDEGPHSINPPKKTIVLCSQWQLLVNLVPQESFWVIVFPMVVPCCQEQPLEHNEPKRLQLMG